MNQKTPTIIQKSKLLIVEGKDEEVFFKELFKKTDTQDTQIVSSGGKQQFKKIFPVIINTPGFEKLQSLAVVQDADQDLQATFNRIYSVLRNNEFEPPGKPGVFNTAVTPKIGVFIISDEHQQGKLESLCLSTVKSQPVMECVDSFMKCIKQESHSTAGKYKQPKDIHKARCRAFLSAMEEDTPSLGIATQKNYWDLDSEKLQALKSFLKQL